MFQEFCTAVMLECVFMQQGRRIVLDAIMENYLVAAIIDGLIPVEIIEEERSIN